MTGEPSGARPTPQSALPLGLAHRRNSPLLRRGRSCQRTKCPRGRRNGWLVPQPGTFAPFEIHPLSVSH